VLVDLHRLRVRERPVPTRDSSSELDLPRGPRIAQPEERLFDPKSMQLARAYADSLTEPLRSYYLLFTASSRRSASLLEAQRRVAHSTSRPRPRV
jgi:hypothetical protein